MCFRTLHNFLEQKPNFKEGGGLHIVNWDIAIFYNLERTKNVEKKICSAYVSDYFKHTEV